MMTDWVARGKQSIYWALVRSLLLVMLLYSISRLAFYVFNLSFFPGISFERFLVIMAGGLRFDLSAALYSNSLFILLMILPVTYRYKHWYKVMLKWIFIGCNSIAFAANTADFVYYRFTLRRTTLSFLHQFENETNLVKLFFHFLFDYWYATLFFAAIAATLVIAYKRIRYDEPMQITPWKFYSLGTIGFLISIGLFVGGARGGFRESTRPITLSNAAAYVKEPREINLVLNTPFALMRTAGANVITKVNYFSSESELNAFFNPVKIPVDTVPFQNKNVVVLILESFSKEFVGAYNKTLEGGSYKGYTPFLDSLISVSHSFQYSMANGRKSIDAMPSVICSIPSIEVPYVLSHYSGNKINSLPSLLREKGYYSAFFHGAPNGSMGFDAFANLSGFDAYYGKDEYNNNDDFDGIWGIWDEKFLQFFADKMNRFKPPFFTTMFTVSSHHPYNLPRVYDGVFKGGPKPVHRTIQYTDMALRKFFARASTMPWFNQTIFVLAADHASAEIQFQQYNSPSGYFAIPIIFFEPGGKPQAMKNEIVQQIDIMPTILGLLHYDRPFVSFGRNIFSDEEPFAFNYLNNTYQSLMGDYLLQFDGKNTIGLYDFKRDPRITKNILSENTAVVEKMEPKLKAFIQQYNNRMVDDDLTVAGRQR